MYRQHDQDIQTGVCRKDCRTCRIEELERQVEALKDYRLKRLAIEAGLEAQVEHLIADRDYYKEATQEAEEEAEKLDRWHHEDVDAICTLTVQRDRLAEALGDVATELSNHCSNSACSGPGSITECCACYGVSQARAALAELEGTDGE